VVIVQCLVVGHTTTPVAQVVHYLPSRAPPSLA
jgi:hypothetical protein